MLTISTDTLPQNCLSYLAFRAAFQETLERIALANQVGEAEDGFGYLTEVPFLRSIPPHVQLDLLAETWSKHVSCQPFEANLVDESVVYAVCETSARIVEQEPVVFFRYLIGGPLDVEIVPDHFLASELRGLHVNLSNEGDFLMISQFEDMDPEEARQLKQQFGIDEAKLNVMFAVLGLWTMSADFLERLQGLLTKHEIVRAVAVLGER